MNKENQIVKINQSLENFADAFQRGIEGIVTAAEIYVAAIDDDPRNADKFKSKFANIIPDSAWMGFEAVGRKWLHPNLLMGGVADRRKNSILKRLPYSIQERIFEHERFPLLLDDGKTLEVDILEAQIEQVEQICDKSQIRTVAAQKAWKESKKALPEKSEVLPYVISDNKITFRRAVSMTRYELKRILAEM